MQEHICNLFLFVMFHAGTHLQFVSACNVSCRNTFAIFPSNSTHLTSLSPPQFAIVMFEQAQRNERQNQYGLHHICSDCSCYNARRKNTTPFIFKRHLFYNLRIVPPPPQSQRMKLLVDAWISYLNKFRVNKIISQCNINIQLSRNLNTSLQISVSRKSTKINHKI